MTARVFDPPPALLTDLYELTMAAAYSALGMAGKATFSLFIRGPSPARRYFVCAGLEGVIAYLKAFRFTASDIRYLGTMGLFRPEFLAGLGALRFTGDVRAVPEGRLVFADEPLLEITAPIVEAQLVETAVLNLIHGPTLIATKAARCVSAAGGRRLVDFALRRVAGPDAGLTAARSSYLAGFWGTSNVLAGKLYGIPVSGTMAHSFVAGFGREIDAFRAYAEVLPENTILLVDTYDTVRGARNAARVGREMARRGYALRGVRLDSGDIAALSRKVRRILAASGLEKAAIVASGGLDEFEIRRILRAGGDVDAFGVGTKMGVSADAPYLDLAYKLVRCEDAAVLKLSPDKATLPGEKQVFRSLDARGRLGHDVVGLKDERFRGAEPLLRDVMKGGRLVRPLPALGAIRAAFLEEFGRLDGKYKSLSPAAPRYPVRRSRALIRLRAETRRAVLKAQTLGGR